MLKWRPFCHTNSIRSLIYQLTKAEQGYKLSLVTTTTSIFDLWYWSQISCSSFNSFWSLVLCRNHSRISPCDILMQKNSIAVLDDHLEVQNETITSENPKPSKHPRSWKVLVFVIIGHKILFFFLIHFNPWSCVETRIVFLLVIFWYRKKQCWKLNCRRRPWWSSWNDSLRKPKTFQAPGFSNIRDCVEYFLD